LLGACPQGKKLYRRRVSAERAFGRLKNEWAFGPLRVRGIDRVKLHADLTIVACLASALAKQRRIDTAR